MRVQRPMPLPPQALAAAGTFRKILALQGAGIGRKSDALIDRDDAAATMRLMQDEASPQADPLEHPAVTSTGARRRRSEQTSNPPSKGCRDHTECGKRHAMVTAPGYCGLCEARIDVLTTCRS